MAPLFAFIASQGSPLLAFAVVLRDDLFLLARVINPYRICVFPILWVCVLVGSREKDFTDFLFPLGLVTARAFVKACCIVCGFCICTNFPTFPQSPETYLAKQMRSVFSLWIRWATGSFTLRITFCARFLQRSANSWGLSPFSCFAVWSFKKWYWSMCASLNLSRNAFFNFSHVASSAWSQKFLYTCGRLRAGPFGNQWNILMYCG